MHLIFERLKGATFQIELLVMTLLGLANCTLNWSPFEWMTQAEKITKMTMTSQYSEEIKTVLRWVVITRIIIDHMYFASYLGNLYCVFTWCRPKLLLLWLIVSALKNVLLEFVSFVVAVVLYLEGNFPSILFVEFIVERAITFAIAAYYWCGIKKLFAELSERQRRKLTRANLIANLDSNAAILEIFTENFTDKRKEVTSLTNVNESSFHSSFEFDGNPEQYRLTKSLTTLTTMDSQVSVESEKNLTLLTPAAKAMRILGLNQDDVNEARIRLGKSVLTNTLGVKEMEDQYAKVHTTALPISAQNMTHKEITNEGSVSQVNTKPKEAGQSSVKYQRDIEVSSTQSPSKDPTNETPRNPPKRCTCIKSNDVSSNGNGHENMKKSLIKIPGEDGHSEYEEKDDDSSGNRVSRQTGIPPTTPSKKRVNNELKIFGPSVFWSVDFPRSDLNKKDVDLSDWSSDENVKNSEVTTSPSLQVNRTLQSLLASSLGTEDVGCLHGPSDHLKSVNVELFRVNEISLEDRKRTEDNTDISENEVTYGNSEEVPHQHSLFRIDDTSSVRSKQVEENSENITSVRNSLEVDIQTDFDDDAEQWSIDQDLAEGDFFLNTSRASTSTQTNISDVRKKTLTNLKKPLEALIDRHSSETLDSSNSKPQDLPTHPRKMLISGMTRFAKMRKRPERIEEREAREMRALRAYNKLTLLEDKREMEMKGRNAAFRNRTGIQGLICSNNLMNIPMKTMREVPKAEPKQKLENERVQPQLDQLPKRQARSRPQEKTSKLSTFYLGLDALENSISLSFSSENKNRSKLHDVKNNSNQTQSNSQQIGRKKLTKYSKPIRIFDETNVSSPSTTRIEGLQTGRDLDRTRGMVNIADKKTIREVDNDIERYNQNRLQDVFSGTILSSLESLQTQQQNTLGINEVDDIVELHDKHGISGLKEAIKNIDWGYNNHTSYGDDVVQRENVANSYENVLYDIIDDTDTISLLQSAFASNPGNTERGFYLGPGSTELYSVSNYLEDVVEEIMKTARLRPNPDAFTTESTTEVDYGDSYLQEFQVTTLLTAENSDEETLMDSNSETDYFNDKTIEEVESMISVQFVPSKPVELDTKANHQLSIVVTDSDNERIEEDQFDSESYRDRLTLKNRDGRTSIVELLGEEEISHVEYWAKELKDLASNDRRNDFEFTKEFRHLTRLPGFCVVKMLVDFFRQFVAVSRSTMTSRMFLGANAASTPSSMESEELISRHINEDSNTSATNDSQNIPNNVEPLGVVESHVSDSLQALIDEVPESTDTSNPPNDPVFGAHDDRSIFPLREDQFYFGTPGNTRHLIKEILTSKPEQQGNQVTPNLQKKPTDSEIDAHHVTEQPSAEAHVPITFYILGATSITQDSSQAHRQGAILSENAEAPFKIDSTADSFDSLYSAGAAGNFKSSSNVISIGAASSFEEFPEDTLISRSTIESHNPDFSEPSNPEDNN